jgi:RND superfamily putative drug exporter
VAPDGKKVTDSPYSDAIDTAYKAYGKDKHVSDVVSPLTDAGADQLAKDKETAYITLTPDEGAGDLSTEEAQAILDVATPAEKSGLQVSIGGYPGDKLSAASSDLSEVIGLLAAIIILLLTFGTLVAMSMPIMTAIFGLGVGISLVGLLSTVVQVPTAAVPLATMIGLGVGIDYGLFVVTQHRRQMADGMDVHESAARATAIAGGAVVFAGSTVIIALLALMVAGIPIVSALGYTSAIVVAVAMTAAITLLPAVMGKIGTRINSLAVPGIKGGVKEERGPWHRWAEMINRRPWPAIVISVGLLVILAIPAFSLDLGQTDDGSVARGTQARTSFDALAEGFGAGVNGPLLIAIDMSKDPAKNNQKSLDEFNDQQAEQEQAVEAGQAPPPTSSQQSDAAEQKTFLESKSSDSRLQQLRDDLEKVDNVASVSQPDVNDKGDAAIMTVTPDSSPSSQATVDLVNELRADAIPKDVAGKGMTAYVGGSTAGYIDLAAQISDRLPEVILLVLVLSFFLLMLAFRSVLVPLKAVAMNVFSIAASFGVVNFVFSHDGTAKLLGLDGAVPIVSFVPLMMFAILFGLSMDYEVFLMTHVREEFLTTGDAHGAVVEGLAGTARVITSAALIMVSVFLAFILSGDPNIKQFGVGMAAAVAIDATIVRCALVPGIMRLLGARAWWFPGWLDKITPQFSIEGKDWFARRGAASAAPDG